MHASAKSPAAEKAVIANIANYDVLVNLFNDEGRSTTDAPPDRIRDKGSAMTVQDYGLTTPASNRRVPKISEIVAAELRQKILRGEIPEGESLTPESELVLEYNVSRPSLREALRLLESQGLVAIRRGSHRGPIAAKPDTEQVVNAFTMHLQLRKGTLPDIYRFRMIFEPVAARMAAEACHGRRRDEAEVHSLPGAGGGVIRNRLRRDRLALSQ